MSCNYETNFLKPFSFFGFLARGILADDLYWELDGKHISVGSTGRLLSFQWYPPGVPGQAGACECCVTLVHVIFGKQNPEGGHWRLLPSAVASDFQHPAGSNTVPCAI